jgi:hypothetical protein
VFIGSDAITFCSLWPHLEHSNERCSKPSGPSSTAAVKRLLAQQGAFLLFGLTTSFEEDDYSDIKVHRKTIPADSKTTILEQLDKININPSSLFPEIEGAASYILSKLTPKAAVIFLACTAGNVNGRIVSSVMAGVAFAVDGGWLGSATESYAVPAPYTTLASLARNV